MSNAEPSNRVDSRSGASEETDDLQLRLEKRFGSLEHRSLSQSVRVCAALRACARQRRIHTSATLSEVAGTLLLVSMRAFLRASSRIEWESYDSFV